MHRARLPRFVAPLLCVLFGQAPQTCGSTDRIPASKSTVIQRALAEWEALGSVEFYWHATFRYTGPRGKNPYDVPTFTTSGLFRWRKDGAYYLERYESTSGEPERIVVSELRGTRRMQTGSQVLQTGAQGLIGIDLTVKRLFSLALLTELATVDGYYVTEQGNTEYMDVACHAMRMELVDKGGRVIERCHVLVAKKSPGAVLKAEWYAPEGQRRLEYHVVSFSQVEVSGGNVVLLPVKVRLRNFVLYDKTQRSFQFLTKPWAVEEIRLLPRSLRIGDQLPDAAFLAREWAHGTQLATPNGKVTFLKRKQAKTQEFSAPATTPQHGTRKVVVAQAENELTGTSTWGLVLAVIGTVCLGAALLLRWQYR